jgi:hypothetical protein
MGLSQGRSFSLSWGSLTECLGYLGQVFDFLDQSFERPAQAAQPPETVISRCWPQRRQAAAG